MIRRPPRSPLFPYPTLFRSFAEPLRPRRHRRFHHAGKSDAHQVVREVVHLRLIRDGSLEGPLVRIDERKVETQRLLRELEPCTELARTVAPRGEDGSGLGQERHQIFSMFTRNALNSGVRAPTSPTNGVRAFASQYCEMALFCSAEVPKKPQWMGMPMW